MSSADRARRWALGGSWFALVVTALYLYLFRRDAVQHRLDTAFSASLGVAAFIYLAVGSARAFTLIPSTYLVLAGLPFFPPVPLFILSLCGILISSALIYRFSEALHLEELFERGTHRAQVERIRALMQRHEMPIIIGWSFFPLVPTDLICYVAGILEVNFARFLVSVMIGEGAICAIYIFLGGEALRFLGVGL